MSQQQRQQETINLVLRAIYRYVRQRFGLDLSDYATVSELFELLRDLFTFINYLKRKIINEYLPELVKLWQRHYKLITAYIGVGSVTFTLLLKNGTFKEKLLDVLVHFVNHVPTIVLMFSACVFVTQCIEMNKMMTEFASIIQDHQQIEANMTVLRECANRLRALLEQLELENLTAEEESSFLEQINRDLLEAGRCRETLEMIVRLRNEILANTIRYEEEQKDIKNNAIQAGVMGALSIGLILLNPLSTTVGVINVVAGAVIGTRSYMMDSKISEYLTDFGVILEKLAGYERELRELQEQFEQFSNQRDQIVARRIRRLRRPRKRNERFGSQRHALAARR